MTLLSLFFLVVNANRLLFILLVITFFNEKDIRVASGERSGITRTIFSLFCFVFFNSIRCQCQFTLVLLNYVPCWKHFKCCTFGYSVLMKRQNRNIIHAFQINTCQSITHIAGLCTKLICFLSEVLVRLHVGAMYLPMLAWYLVCIQQ